MATDEKPPGDLLEVDFRSRRPVQSSESEQAADSSSDPPAKVIDLTKRLPQQSKGNRDCVDFETRNGEVNLIVRMNGRKQRYGDKPGTGNTNLLKWAELLVSACRTADRAREANKTSDILDKVLRGETCEPPRGDKWEREAMLERLPKSTALAVARSLWALDLDDMCCIAIAEGLTGRKMAPGSSPRTQGPSLGVDRGNAVFLVMRWREQVIAKGLIPMTLRLRDKTAEVAQAAAQRQQRDSGVKCFRYHKRKGYVEVWLCEGNWQSNLTGQHCDEPKPLTRGDAIAWAKAYAQRNGFPYVEGI